MRARLVHDTVAALAATDQLAHLDRRLVTAVCCQFGPNLAKTGPEEGKLAVDARGRGALSRASERAEALPVIQLMTGPNLCGHPP